MIFMTSCKKLSRPEGLGCTKVQNLQLIPTIWYNLYASWVSPVLLCTERSLASVFCVGGTSHHLYPAATSCPPTYRLVIARNKSVRNSAHIVHGHCTYIGQPFLWERSVTICNMSNCRYSEAESCGTEYWRLLHSTRGQEAMRPAISWCDSVPFSFDAQRFGPLQALLVCFAGRSQLMAIRRLEMTLLDWIGTWALWDDVGFCRSCSMHPVVLKETTAGGFYRSIPNDCLAPYCLAVVRRVLQ